jgi:hypothetical protein
MSLSYTITRSLTFDEDTGYWNVNIEVTGADGLDPKPFLVEKAVATGNSIQSSEEQPRYLRTLLKNEPEVSRDDTDTTVVGQYTWLKYKTNSVSRSFYTYASAESALNSALAILRSNANVYSQELPKPKAAATNLSAKKTVTQLGEVDATKGDILSVQIVDGPKATSITGLPSSDLLQVLDSGSSTRVSTGVFRVRVVSEDLTHIQLNDAYSGKVFTIQVNMLPTPLESDSITEVIK